jgi:hypothetical protein
MQSEKDTAGVCCLAVSSIEFIERLLITIDLGRHRLVADTVDDSRHLVRHGLKQRKLVSVSRLGKILLTLITTLSLITTALLVASTLLVSASSLSVAAAALLTITTVATASSALVT